MKTLHLVSTGGDIRSGKASTDQIADVLEGRESDLLATVSLEDGAIVATPLTAIELDHLRVGLNKRRADELLATLDHELVARRAIEDMRGVSCYGAVTLDLDEVPWAEDVIRDWAAARGLSLRDEPMPTDPKKKTWRRTADVKLSDKSWSSTIVSMVWPTMAVDPQSLIARDAEIDGRTSDAEMIRAEEMPF